MSLLSMTGYGRGEAKGKGFRVEVELSSVNRKQLDIRVLLPRSLAALEARMAGTVQEKISRGRVTGEVRMTQAAARPGAGIEIDLPRARGYLAALRKACREMDLEENFDGGLLLELPEVVRFQEREVDAEAAWPTVQRALKGALKNLLAMKREEGRALKADLAQRFATLSGYVARIEERAPRVAENYRKLLTTRLESAGVEVHEGDERLLKEVALFADKADVAEELTRLKSHLAQAAARLKTREPAGKPLDFLAQELFREINTIGSKANDLDVTRAVLDFKAELERAREQIQNIE